MQPVRTWVKQSGATDDRLLGPAPNGLHQGLVQEPRRSRRTNLIRRRMVRALAVKVTAIDLMVMFVEVVASRLRGSNRIGLCWGLSDEP